MFQAVPVPKFAFHFRWGTFRRWSRRNAAAETRLCQFRDCDADAASGAGSSLCCLHRSLVEQLDVQRPTLH